MSGEEELQLIEAAAFRYARKMGATMRDANEVSEHVVKRARKATEYAVGNAGFGDVLS